MWHIIADLKMKCNAQVVHVADVAKPENKIPSIHTKPVFPQNQEGGAQQQNTLTLAVVLYAPCSLLECW